MAELLGDAILKLSTDSKGYERGLKRSKKGAESLERTFKQTAIAAAAVGASLVGIGFALKKGFDFAQSGAKIAAQRKAFENLAKSHGSSAKSIIKSIKDISRNTVTEAAIVENANKALLLGISPDKFGKLIEIARAASKATGDSIETSFQDITIGIGRQSKLILDNLGIIVSIEKANAAYAKQLGKTAAKLTDAEKKQAFLNATLKAGQAIIDGVGNKSVDSADKMAQFTTAMKDMSDQFKVGTQKALIETVSLFQKINNFVTSIAKKLPTIDLSAFTLAGAAAKNGILPDELSGPRAKNSRRSIAQKLRNAPAIVKGAGSAKFGNIAASKSIEIERIAKAADDAAAGMRNLDSIARGTQQGIIDRSIKMEEAIRSFGNTFADNMVDMFTSANVTFRSILQSFVTMLAKMAARAAVSQGLSALFSNAPKAGTTGPPAPGGLSGGLFQGIGKIFGFAKGGVVPGPQGAPVPAVVHGGERIIPNGGGGGGSEVVQNINISPGLPETVRAEIAQFMPAIRQAAVEAVESARNRGGGMALAMGARA